MWGRSWRRTSTRRQSYQGVGGDKLRGIHRSYFKNLKTLMSRGIVHQANADSLIWEPKPLWTNDATLKTNYSFLTRGGSLALKSDSGGRSTCPLDGSDFDSHTEEDPVDTAPWNTRTLWPSEENLYHRRNTLEVSQWLSFTPPQATQSNSAFMCSVLLTNLERQTYSEMLPKMVNTVQAPKEKHLVGAMMESWTLCPCAQEDQVGQFLAVQTLL